MKLVIEQQDIDEVSDNVLGYYGVDLTDEQTKTFIENEKGMAGQAFQFGWSDTEVSCNIARNFYERLCSERWPGEEDGMFEKLKEKAKEFGAIHTVSATADILSEVKKVNEDRNPDVIIVCTGALSAAKQAIECAGPGSTIIFFAVPKP